VKVANSLSAPASVRSRVAGCESLAQPLFPISEERTLRTGAGLF
jgi:hypothetical protein